MIPKSWLACLVLAAVLLCAGAMACAQDSRWLVCDVWPPYQIETAEGLSGLSVDTVRAVYKRMGVDELTIHAFPWKRALEMVRFGKAEALFSANYTRDREVYTFYPDEPLVESPWVIWTRGGLKVRSLVDLKGMTIGVVLGYSYTPEFWQFIETNCNVEKVHNDEINFVKLDRGRLDAIIAEYGNGHYLVSKIQGSNIHPNPAVTIKKDGLYIIFNRTGTSREFVNEFSDELKKFKRTDEYKSLAKHYLGLVP